MMMPSVLASIADRDVMLTFLVLIVVFAAVVSGIYLSAKHNEQIQARLKRLEEKLDLANKPR